MDSNLVNELRQMFIDGATPSKLMQHIAEYHGNNDRLHFLIMDYFREAFGIPLLRNVVSWKDYSPDLHHAHFNRDIVPEMIARIGEWNTANLQDTWLNGFSVNLLDDHRERLSQQQFEELKRVWDTLSEKEKQFIVRRIALKDYYWDIINTLALLAERLQEKIDKLENRKNDASGLDSFCT